MASSTRPELYINANITATNAYFSACSLTAAGLLGFIANTIQLVLICRAKNQNNSVFALAVLSLNIADLMTSFVILISGVVRLLRLFGIFDLSLSKKMIYPLITALTFSLMSSIFHVVFIAIQRLIAVVFPLKVKQILTKRRCYIILPSLWVTSIAIAIIAHINYKLAFTSLAYVGILICISLVVMYTVICYKIMNRNTVNNNNSEERQRRRQKSERGVMIYSVAITIVFIICFAPKILSSFVTYPMYLGIISDMMYSINPFFDTLLYFLWSHCRQRERQEVSEPVPRQNLQNGSHESTL